MEIIMLILIFIILFIIIKINILSYEDKKTKENNNKIMKNKEQENKQIEIKNTIKEYFKMGFFTTLGGLTACSIISVIIWIIINVFLKNYISITY